MQKCLSVINMSIILRTITIVLSLITMLILNSCNDDSDQMVYETDSKKHFEIDEIIEVLRLDKSSFKEDVITVEGFVKDINYLNKRQTVLLTGKENTSISVICDMQKSQTKLLQNLELGKLTTIKGVLKGSLKDVILLNCIISNQSDQHD